MFKLITNRQILESGGIFLLQECKKLTNREQQESQIAHISLTASAPGSQQE